MDRGLYDIRHAAASEVSAVKALFGEISIGGKLPVSIPGFAQYGDGISIAAWHPGIDPR